ncbi:MAG: hypothetical protein H6608_09770 [Flavobacteriales bacterium]|nr:hypothetical protein [Flavobacteriales bacterium]
MLPARSFPFLENQAKECTSTFSDFLPNGKFTPGLHHLSDSLPAGSQVGFKDQMSQVVWLIWEMRIYSIVGNFISTDGPTYPVILTIKATGYLGLVDNADSLTNSNALGLIKGVLKNFQVYDEDGRLWKVEKVDSNFKVNGLTKFLAYTVYNPKVMLTIGWTKITDYKLDDLKKDIIKQVDRDDDIITQFEEGEVIKRQIENCESFDSIVKTLEKYVFKVNEEELLKETESRK